jgi:hypothetical protein
MEKHPLVPVPETSPSSRSVEFEFVRMGKCSYFWVIRICLLKLTSDSWHSSRSWAKCCRGYFTPQDQPRPTATLFLRARGSRIMMRTEARIQSSLSSSSILERTLCTAIGIISPTALPIPLDVTSITESQTFTSFVTWILRASQCAYP